MGGISQHHQFDLLAIHYFELVGFEAFEIYKLVLAQLGFDDYVGGGVFFVEDCAIGA